jgi:hypothetical protein
MTTSTRVSLADLADATGIVPGLLAAEVRAIQHAAVPIAGGGLGTEAPSPAEPRVDGFTSSGAESPLKEPGQGC